VKRKRTCFRWFTFVTPSETIETKGRQGTLAGIAPVHTVFEKDGHLTTIPNSVFIEEAVRQQAGINMNLAYLDAFTLSVLVFLTIFMPIYGIWEDRQLKRWLADGWPEARVTSYRGTIALEWVGALGMLFWWLQQQRPVDPLFLTWQVSGWRLLVAGLALAVAIAIIFQTRRAVNNPDELAKIRDSIGDLESLVPETPREVKIFNVLAISAGVCEEIMYRGVLQAILASIFGWWLAVPLSGLIFGLAHAYQGPVGILKTGLLGMLMSVLTIFTGTLIPAILLHIVVDLTSGHMMTAALRQERQGESLAAER